MPTPVGCESAFRWLAVRFSESMDALPPKVNDQNVIIESFSELLFLASTDAEVGLPQKQHIARGRSVGGREHIGARTTR